MVIDQERGDSENCNGDTGDSIPHTPGSLLSLKQQLCSLPDEALLEGADSPDSLAQENQFSSYASFLVAFRT